MDMRIPNDIRGHFVPRMAVLLLAVAPLGMAYAEYTPFPDNDARAAILAERKRVDAIQIDFDKLRGDAKLFRTEGEAIRREMETIRRDLDKERQRIDLMLRKVIDDELRPVSESVKKGIDELEILKGAQLDLLTQLEEARKEVRELRGQVEESKSLAGSQRGQMEETRTLATRQDEQQRAL